MTLWKVNNLRDRNNIVTEQYSAYSLEEEH
jgi:hypothetical protein